MLVAPQWTNPILNQRSGRWFKTKCNFEIDPVTISPSNFHYSLQSGKWLPSLRYRPSRLETEWLYPTYFTAQTKHVCADPHHSQGLAVSLYSLLLKPCSDQTYCVPENHPFTSYAAMLNHAVLDKWLTSHSYVACKNVIMKIHSSVVIIKTYRHSIV